jgi:hypothetical protein
VRQITAKHQLLSDDRHGFNRLIQSTPRG